MGAPLRLLDDELKLNDDNLMVPSFMPPPTPLPFSTGPAGSAGPVTASQSNTTQSFSWTDIGKTAVAGLVQGIFKPPAPPKPTVIGGGGSGISTGLVVAGVGAAVLIGVLLLRRQSA